MNLRYSLLLTLLTIKIVQSSALKSDENNTQFTRQTIIEAFVSELDTNKNTEQISIPRTLLMGALEELLPKEDINAGIVRSPRTTTARPFPPHPTTFENVYVQNQLMVNGPATTKGQMYIMGDLFAGKKGQMCFNAKSNSLGLGTNKPLEMLDVRGNANIQDTLTTGNLNVENLSDGFLYSEKGSISTGELIAHGDLADNSVGTFQLIDRCVTPDKLSADLTHGLSSPAETGLKVVRGTIASDGTIVSGTGFSVDVASTGVYNITFTYSFNGTDDYIVLVTPSTSVNRRISSQNTSSNNTTVYTASNDSGTPVAEQFSFLAIGI